MAKGFAKVRVSKGSVRLIEIVRETPERIIGWRVEKDGSRWDRDDGKAVAQELVIAKPHDVVARLRMNFHYGELECA